MHEQSHPPGLLSPLSTVDFDCLLRRSALNSRLARIGSRANQGGLRPPDFTPIGETAGAVWQVLEDDGPTTFANLIDGLSVPESLLFMAIGWLARENKIEFESYGGDYTIRAI
jgi:hypothetical protein